MKVFSLLLAVLLVVGNVPAAFAGDAKAILINKEGKPVGKLILHQGPDGLVLELSVDSLSKGAHGIHFHEKGDCSDRETFKSAGGHIMTEGQGDGYLHEGGPHAGSLPNIVAGADGVAQVEIYTNLVALYEGEAALLDEDGSAFVVHEKADDYISQTAAGARIACAVIEEIK